MLIKDSDYFSLKIVLYMIVDTMSFKIYRSCEYYYSTNKKITYQLNLIN